MAYRENFPDIHFEDALPALEEVVMQQFESQPDLVSAVYNVESSSRSIEQDLTIAGLKAVVAKNEGDAVSFDDPIEGYDKTYTHTTYALAVAFSEEYVEDDRMSVIQKTLQSLGDSMYQTRQSQAASLFNDGFGDTGPDGANLFSTSHTLIGGGTHANRPSTDISMSVGGLRVMEIDMQKMVNHRALNVMIQPKTLVHAPDTMHTANELMKSMDRPDTANRSTNVHYGAYDLVCSSFLTSATAWFALSEKARHSLKWYERVAPSTKAWADDKTGDVITRIRSRFSQGYSDWLGTWGTTG